MKEECVVHLASHSLRAVNYYILVASMYLLDMVMKDYITRTRASIKGAVLKARHQHVD